MKGGAEEVKDREVRKTRLSQRRMRESSRGGNGLDINETKKGMEREGELVLLEN